jgi:hypothetical protein
MGKSTKINNSALETASTVDGTIVGAPVISSKPKVSKAKAAGGVSKKSSKGGQDGGSKKRKRGEKKLRDPNAPTRPQTAFFLFSNHVRPQVKAQNPDAKMTQLSKIIGEQWKALSEDAKKPYNEAAAAAKLKYEGQRETYIKTPEYEAFQAKLKAAAKLRRQEEAASSRSAKQEQNGSEEDEEEEEEEEEEDE